jgi:hypothetical protein
MKALSLALVAMWSGTALAGRNERLQPAGATDTEVLKGNVLVWHDAALFTEPNESAPVVHAASLKGDRKDAVGDVVPMHVVSATKDFVEVEPAAEMDCAWSRLQTTDDLARLRLFVRRADLAPAIVAPFEKSFPDGSRIALRPGVAVVPTSDGKFVVGMRNATVVIEIPTAALGHAYTPDVVKAPAVLVNREYELAAKTAASLGDHAVTLQGLRAQSYEPHGVTSLLSIKTRCVALDVVAPTRAIKAIDNDDEEGTVGGSSGLGVLELRDHDYIAPGTPLSTASGRVVAAAAKPIYLMSSPHGKTACIERHVRVGVLDGEALDPKDGDDRLRVCAPSGRVIHERVRSSSSGNGATAR